jgi:hypothetical protein
MQEKIYEQYKNESLQCDAFLDFAMINEVSDEEDGQGIEKVTAKVEIVDGKARIDLRSKMYGVKTRVITADANELSRFWGWFMTLPYKLAEKDTEGEKAYAVGMGKIVRVYVMDGKIFPVDRSSFIKP